jgi:hypothetical protein
MEKKIILELTVQEVNTILAGLGELPAKLSMNLIAQIENTANGQLKEVTPEIKETEVENGKELH